MATEGPPRPDTTYVSEQPNGSYHLMGTGAEVNNRASRVGSSNNNPSYHPPSPSPNVSTRVGAGLGFASVAIATGAVLLWKRNRSSIIGTKSDSNAHIGSTTRRNKEELRTRRGSSSKRKIGTIGRGRPLKNRKENRTIYDSDSSVDSAFEINKRMKIDPFAFEMSRRMKIDPFADFAFEMKIDPVNSDSDSSESSYVSVTPHRNRVQSP